MPAFLASIACFVNLDPNLKAAVPGIPRFATIRVILPAVVCSAFSSNVVRSSKKDSTCAALLVPKPMSIRDAPREKAPFGMSISPAAIPDKTLCIVPTLLSLKLVLKSLTLTLIGVVLISTMTKHSEFARTLLLFLDYQRFLIHCFY